MLNWLNKLRNVAFMGCVIDCISNLINYYLKRFKPVATVQFDFVWMWCDGLQNNMCPEFGWPARQLWILDLTKTETRRPSPARGLWCAMLNCAVWNDRSVQLPRAYHVYFPRDFDSADPPGPENLCSWHIFCLFFFFGKKISPNCK